MTSTRGTRYAWRVSRAPRPLVGLACAGVLGTALAPGCSLGDGTGTVSGVLDVPQCWSGEFDLRPDFFAAVPAATSSPGTSLNGEPGSDTLQLRIQNGGDYEAFSDGLAILVDDAGEVLGTPTPEGTPRPSLLGQPLIVSLPVGVEPSGIPITPMAFPPIVHASLYLQKTCQTSNVALYALDAVSLEPDGSCSRPSAGDAPLPCGTPAIATTASDGGAQASLSSDAGSDTGSDAAVGAEAGTVVPPTGGIGTSTIVFDNLFDGNPDEADAQKRLTTAHFTFYLADPRDICPGGIGPPPRCRGYLTGDFKFYFERGRPAQPFP